MEIGDRVSYIYKQRRIEGNITALADCDGRIEVMWEDGMLSKFRVQYLSGFAKQISGKTD